MLNKISIFLFLIICFQSADAEWVKQSTNSFAWFRDVFFVNQNKGWITGTDGAMLTTDDGGKTWIAVRRFTTDAILQIHFSDEINGWMLCESNIYSRGAKPNSYLRNNKDGCRKWEMIAFESDG